MRLSKAEKRLAARAAKEEIRIEKRAVEVQAILGEKRVAQVANPSEEKIVPDYEIGTSTYTHKATIIKTKEDREGAWSWGQLRNWHPTPGDSHVYGLLDPYAHKTWGEIHGERVGKKSKRKPPDKRHKAYDLSLICEEAYKRLVTLQLDDRETIFRFRFGGMIRIYGFIVGTEFHLLWYDPDHKIYPMSR